VAAAALAAVATASWLSGKVNPSLPEPEPLAQVGASQPLASHEPASPTAPPAATTAASITLRVVGSPATAKVFDGERELGMLGAAIEMPPRNTSMSLTVRAPGFASKELDFTPARDTELRVTLERAMPRAPGKAHELEY
jgi:hypothetical protein